eukprot:TRINITY_DN1119_c0_g1_i1.p1 TRINITY_DN1119_c0_g1~~TRINITY_DN1119_c0_g1_i1.p1  ORF type:complete len:127 (-),score=16.98 TRINITY_DN1119_c0_g1_i1:102-482(-)
MNTLVVCAALIGTISCLPYPQGGAPANPLPIPRPGKDGSYAGDQFFQYINVPALNTFEWGFRRGNADHNIEEYLSQKDSTFKSKLKWHDAHGGHGEHYYDYNHVGKEEPKAYGAPPPKPAYGAPSN